MLTRLLSAVVMSTLFHSGMVFRLSEDSANFDSIPDKSLLTQKEQKALDTLRKDGVPEKLLGFLKKHPDLVLLGDAAESCSFPKAEIFKHMDAAGPSGAPKPFQGIVWMDGNTLNETLKSFKMGKWIPGVEACRKHENDHYTEEERTKGIVRGPNFKGSTPKEVPCQGVFESGNWDAYRGFAAETEQYKKGLMHTAYAFIPSMIFTCGGPSPTELTICKLRVTPDQQYGNLLPWMVKVSDHLWIRYTSVQKAPEKCCHQYFMKTIVDASGKNVDTVQEPFMTEFLSAGQATPTATGHDVFGMGGELDLIKQVQEAPRAHVEKVGETQYTRCGPGHGPTGNQTAELKGGKGRRDRLALASGRFLAKFRNWVA